MSSSYLLNLKINQLQQEVQGIGESIGYFFDVTSSNGLTIDGSGTAVNISAPNNNNTMNGASNVTRGAPWKATATVQANSNMWFGVSTDITQSFPNPSVPSMSMCNNGFLCDTENSVTNGYIITNGIISGTDDVKPGDIVSITYDGTTLIYKVNNTIATTVSVPTLPGVRLVCGSFSGGRLNNITWSGTGSSGGGGGGNLEDVLATGNNGGGIGMTNVGNINTSGNIIAENIKSNAYLEIGNAAGGTSQLHFLYGNGTTSGNNYQIIGDNGNDSLAIQLYENNILKEEPFKITPDQVIVNQELYTVNGIQSDADVLLVSPSKLTVETNVDGNDTFSLEGSTTSPEVSITYYDSSNTPTNLINMSNILNNNSDRTITYTFGDDFSPYSIPIIQIKGSEESIKQTGVVLDSVWNPPTLFLNTSLQSTTSKVIPYNQTVSILSFNLNGFNTSNNNIYNLATMLISTLNVANFQVKTGTNTSPLFLQLWVSDVKDDNFIAGNPMIMSYTSPNLGFGGSPSGFKATKVLMSYIKELTFGSTLFINCKVNGATDPSNTFVLNGLSFNTAQIQLQPTLQDTTPAVIVL